MANLKIDWFGRSLSHRADKTSNTYAKVNSITGKTFLVTLRNPYTSDRFKDANIAQNNKMGALWMGIAATLLGVDGYYEKMRDLIKK